MRIISVLFFLEFIVFREMVRLLGDYYHVPELWQNTLTCFPNLSSQVWIQFLFFPNSFSPHLKIGLISSFPLINYFLSLSYRIRDENNKRCIRRTFTFENRWLFSSLTEITDWYRTPFRIKRWSHWSSFCCSYFSYVWFCFYVFFHT